MDAARQRMGHWEYRVIWEGYPDPTWETDVMLSTAGEQVQTMMREARIVLKATRKARGKPHERLYALTWTFIHGRYLDRHPFRRSTSSRVVILTTMLTRAALITGCTGYDQALRRSDQRSPTNLGLMARTTSHFPYT
eukprot:3753860-Pleurochrysis_carterae.AAC.2